MRTKSFAVSLIVRVSIVGAFVVLMLATAIIFWPKIRFWHEHRLALSLVANLEAGDGADSRGKLRQIASLSDPAIEALVVAATSERVEIALAARQIIEEQLATWQIRDEASSEFDSTRSIGLLARALADHVGSFGSLGQQWAHRLSLTLVETSADFPAETAAVILADCSAIMAAVPALGPRMRTETSDQSWDESRNLAMPDVHLPPRKEMNIGTNSESKVPDMPVTDGVDGSLEEKPFTDSSPLPSVSPWVPEWTQRATLEDPPTPRENDKRVEVTTSKTESLMDVPSPDEMAVQLAKYREEDTRSLLVRLSASEDYDAAIIRSALMERGISPEELPLAMRVLDEDKSQRLALVDDLKVLPARTARHWLLELLKDSEPEVRLKALTALATSNDPGLTLIARDLAVRDPDSRVTELAGRIIGKTR